MTEKAPGTEELFSKLDNHVKASQYKAALKIVEDILKISANDPTALRVKAITHLKKSDFDQALDTIARCDSETASQLALEKAYCLYRTHKLTEALQACETVTDAQVAGRLQLEAQVLYRMGNYAECVSKYQQLMRNHKVDSSELATNLSAAYVAGGRAGEVPALLKELKVSIKEGFEVAYNSACALVEQGQLSEAHERLLMAQRIGQEMLFDEELTDAEVAEELLPITVQLGYVAAASGNAAEAVSIFTEALKTESTDIMSKAVATNNLVAARGPRELFDAMKRFDRIMGAQSAACSTLTATLEARMTPAQKMTLLFTRLLVLMHSNKLPACKEVAGALHERFPSSDVPLMIQAALLLREKKEKSSCLKADEVLAAYAAAHPGPIASQVQLMRAQIAASAGNWKRAVEALSCVAEICHRPAVVATLVAMLEAGGDVAAAEQVMDQAVRALESAPSPPDRASTAMDTDSRDKNSESVQRMTLMAAAAFKEVHGRHQEAVRLYEKLVEAGASDRRGDDVTASLAGLVRSAAHVDLDRAEARAAHLPPMAGVGELDEAAVEAGAGMLGASSRGKRAAAATEEGGGTAGAEAGEKRRARDADMGEGKVSTHKKRKQRKSRLPKDFDEANPPPPPDPERWLPKHERTAFKSKSARRKMKNEVNVKGSQGAGQVSADLEAKLEDKKPAEDTKMSQSKPQPAKKGGKKGKKK